MVAIVCSSVVIVLLSIGTFNGAVTNAKRLEGASPVDALRHRYLQQEKLALTIVEQIDHVTNQVDEDVTRQRSIVLRELFSIYLRFVNDELSPEAAALGDERSYVTVLQRFAEWHQLEQNLLTINQMYRAVGSFLAEAVPRYAGLDAFDAEARPDELADNDLRLQSIDLAETVLYDRRHPIALQLDQIYTIMVRQALYYKVQMVAKSTICSFGLSAQQVLYLLYEAIAMTELKGYLMMQFAYMVLRAQGKGNFTVESSARRNELQTRLNRTHELLQRAMEQTSRDYWRCDPERQAHRENETYLQFTRLLQGYIENEVDMSTENTCRETCGHYQYGHRQEQCYKELYCTRQPKCAGRIYDCEYVDSDMWICPAAPQSQRRYEYIEYENGMVRGRKGYCARGTTKVDSWWRWIFWHCSYCFCVCDDHGPRSDRFVSLREAVSDITKNKVVTGLRFVKRDRVIHLAVQQGTLMPQGEIDNRTLEWVTPSAFSVLAKGIRNGLDYHTLTYDNRSMDLDDVQVYPGYVLTGVRFRLLGTHLNLMIRMTEMNFTSGQLMDLDKSIWIGNDNTITRTELVLKQPDVPTKASSKSIPDSGNGQYIRFTPTDREADAAQTTVPFLDAQPVYTHRAVPLSGAGIMHKGQPKSGGFLALKLLTYDFTTHIQRPLGDDNDLPDIAAVAKSAAMSTAFNEGNLPSIQ
ncbi:uncharacterized protein LOC126569322 isoform X2 [Anopheles aquasalis]|uniref:uncharacterized protein LOC126569322 isoform X2 n=1 Tax=Anopheles aquasalis TaxID=42839 RepID=UPI00215A26EA|nr:uncharacterized protein LOC126569322 isoform X2 [Anopheles aquasalis]XP_050082297.1 uncharacterized protein LOC126569322 isoform X2 [Anopheles aquasalis]XP_050082307.1 uncharacterized protein LOC126569322 isoform X2 [Anopheles aquasalis]XP_050082317.1 uncharacterized protein LOC126569322 isoform X2 [Anopheles aquasalis]XP_050082323.1 uncharacterized protein LOC126569322 isoform X2 [Anopheles aquasalis]